MLRCSVHPIFAKLQVINVVCLAFLALLKYDVMAYKVQFQFKRQHPNSHAKNMLCPLSADSPAIICYVQVHFLVCLHAHRRIRNQENVVSLYIS